jgi:uncharacterized protein YdhG (YjbR/CyaY superfamily)
MHLRHWNRSGLDCPVSTANLYLERFMAGRTAFNSVDEYIASFSTDLRTILRKVRSTIRTVGPRAQERISYGIPAFVQDRRRIYFAAFKKHIGVYPPVRGDEKLTRALSRYRGKKGNLQFPLDEPMPYALIKRVAKALLSERPLAARPLKK